MSPKDMPRVRPQHVVRPVPVYTTSTPDKTA